MTERLLFGDPVALRVRDVTGADEWLPGEVMRGAGGRGGREALRQRLEQITGVLSRPDVRLVVGGHFSCGKSTMLNMLLGRDLLPTGDLPETGVPCELRSGPFAQAVAYTGGGSVPIAV